MQAIRFVEKGRAELGALDLPPPAPGHVLLRVKAAGLCHTDIDVLHARYGAGRFPVTPGHEYAGEVEAIGEGVTRLKIGDRVAVDPNLPCGTCRSCARGLTNLCETLGAYGVSTNGGFAEASLVAADHCHPIGDLAYPVAALAEPLACVLNGLTSAGLGAGAPLPGTALVFGAGPIGLLLALSLKSHGVAEVVVADLNESRLAFAESLGLGAAVSGSDDLAGRRKGFDLVAEATGIPAVVEGMIPLVADGGTALVFGVAAPDARVQLSPFEIFRRQLKLVGSHSLNRNIPQALDILSRDTGPMARLISHRLPLSEMLPFFLKKPGDPATMKVQYVAD
ncbi:MULTISPECIES: zinc-dependent alcohol dehydrogenase family protein [unclassified Aureimonas]|uniref:zinc-dependent alcohol dehydrogenase family protein n=1 Tax=unclassified Aureimonas TaxID=2615206 RepID=UPI0006FFC9A4|nr:MULTISPECIES: zinc-dependent alcohol dehydrogenase family protein [unclassified Aureimonas]KQT68897.1 zinc-binding dehydrogenase [Aureimonas sp. Leaf460]KQT69123.1 zinc-binding dehydrogenase [Aureimonas sp. Leaf427]